MTARDLMFMARQNAQKAKTKSGRASIPGLVTIDVERMHGEYCNLQVPIQEYNQILIPGFL